jgi:hypothetical protein
MEGLSNKASSWSQELLTTGKIFSRDTNMNFRNIALIFLGAIIVLIVVSGCVTQNQQPANGYSQNNPSTNNPSPPFDVNKYVQMASESTSGKTVAVIVSPDRSGLIWQGGPDISSIISWEAKLSDGTVLIDSSSAPTAGQFDAFNENIEGKYLIVTAKFSDGHEQVILSGGV